MTDKLTRMALVVALIVIGLLLLRPAATDAPQFQRTQPVMVVDNATLYVLDDHKISVYYWDSPASRKLILPQIGKLRLLQTLDAQPQSEGINPSR